jgi:hypothetical protein
LGLRQSEQNFVWLLHAPYTDVSGGSWQPGKRFSGIQLFFFKPMIHSENRATDCGIQDAAFFQSMMIDFFEENDNISSSMWLVVASEQAHYIFTCRRKVLRSVQSP